MAYITIKDYIDTDDEFKRPACHLRLNEETGMYVFEKIQMIYHGESTVPIPAMITREIFASSIELSYFDELAADWISKRTTLDTGTSANGE